MPFVLDQRRPPRWGKEVMGLTHQFCFGRCPPELPRHTILVVPSMGSRSARLRARAMKVGPLRRSEEADQKKFERRRALVPV